MPTLSQFNLESPEKLKSCKLETGINEAWLNVPVVVTQKLFDKLMLILSLTVILSCLYFSVTFKVSIVTWSYCFKFKQHDKGKEHFLQFNKMYTYAIM